MLILCLCMFTNYATAKPIRKYKSKVSHKVPRKERIKRRPNQRFVEDIRTSKWFDHLFDEIYIDEHNKLCVIIIEDKNNMVTYKPIDKPRKKVTHDASLDTVYHVNRKIVFNNKNINNRIEIEAKLKKKSKRKWKFKEISVDNHKNKHRGVFYFNQEGKLTSFSNYFKCLDCEKGDMGGVR